MLPRSSALRHLLQVMGYVPQDDVMLADMTVEELLQFSARVRLPAAARPADHLRNVNRTIKVGDILFVNVVVLARLHRAAGSSGWYYWRGCTGLQVVVGGGADLHASEDAIDNRSWSQLLSNAIVVSLFCPACQTGCSSGMCGPCRITAVRGNLPCMLMLRATEDYPGSPTLEETP